MLAEKAYNTGGQSTGEDGEWLGLPARTAGYSKDWSRKSVESASAPVKHHLEHGRYNNDKANNPATPSQPAMVGHVGAEEAAVDWTEYPYDRSTFREDAEGVFNNAGPEHGGILAGREPTKDSKYEYFWKVNNFLPSEEAVPQDDARFSSFSKTDNIMGYPEEDLPIRPTYEFDVTTGGKRYERFWYGEDGIARDKAGVSDYFKDNSKPTSEHDRSDYDDFWGKDDRKSMGSGGYKSFWREDAQLPGNLGGLVDGDDFGDGGLVYLYRRKYDDDTAYESPKWQNQDILERGEGEFEHGLKWPRPMYEWGVDSTDHDLRFGDPMRKTTVEY